MDIISILSQNRMRQIIDNEISMVSKVSYKTRNNIKEMNNDGSHSKSLVGMVGVEDREYL